MNELNVAQDASCKSQDLTDFFLADSPSLCEWFHKNGYRIYMTENAIPMVVWFDGGEQQEMTFDLFAAIVISEAQGRLQEENERENGLLPGADTKSDKSLPDGNDQISMLLDKVRKSGQQISLDRLVRILKSL